MDEAAYKVWLASLPSLNQAQLSDVLNRVKLLSTPRAAKPGQSDFGERMIANIVEVMRHLGVETPSISVLRKSNAYAISRDKIDDLRTFIEGVSQKRLEQDAIIKTGLQLLYGDLANWKKTTVSSHTLLQQIHRIPATLARHFPGYSICGLLTKVVKPSA